MQCHAEDLTEVVAQMSHCSSIHGLGDVDWVKGFGLGTPAVDGGDGLWTCAMYGPLIGCGLGKGVCIWMGFGFLGMGFGLGACAVIGAVGCGRE